MKLREQVKNLKYVFQPRSIAVVGASREPSKIGHVVVKNCLDGGFSGEIYPINPKADEILGLRCYPSVSALKKAPDLVVISIPAPFVPAVVEECGKKGVEGIIVISGGFAEVGNVEGEKKLKEIADKYQIALIGPNCMGVLYPKEKVDTIFLPIYKLGRPHVGKISFISQSGAIGGCLLDLIARAGIGLGKFVSYGNAAVINETDLLAYLAQDKESEVIACYFEGVKDGKKFLEAAREITKHKPVVVLKAGNSDFGAAAAKSHTASIAGNATAYQAAFKQAKVIPAEDMNALYHIPKIFNQPVTTGKRLAIITNGGGNGVLAADAVQKEGLALARFSEESRQKLRAALPGHANVANPLDLTGDADSARYQQALDILMEDANVDAILVIILFQTAAVDSNVAEVVIRVGETRKKPIVVASTGGEYTDMHRRIIDGSGVPTYRTPTTAIAALAKFINYNRYREKIKE